MPSGYAPHASFRDQVRPRRGHRARRRRQRDPRQLGCSRRWGRARQGDELSHVRSAYARPRGAVALGLSRKTDIERRVHDCERQVAFIPLNWAPIPTAPDRSFRARGQLGYLLVGHRPIRHFASSSTVPRRRLLLALHLEHGGGGRRHEGHLPLLARRCRAWYAIFASRQVGHDRRWRWRGLTHYAPRLAPGKTPPARGWSRFGLTNVAAGLVHRVSPPSRGLQRKRFPTCRAQAYISAGSPIVSHAT